MPIERIAITSREQWLQLRKFDITASVAGAVQGLHPYVSPLRLYIEKRGDIELPQPPDSGPLRRGRLLENAVALAVAEQHPHWTLEKCTDYFRDPDLGLGATPDFFIHGDPRGLGVLQAKTAAPSVYEREWASVGRPPMWVLVQVAVEMLLTDAKFGAVAVLVVEPYELPCHVFDVARHEAAEATIRRTVAKFWEDIETGNEPSADYGLDRELVAALSPRETKDKSVDLSYDNEVIAGLIERADLRARIKADEARCSEIETMLMSRMSDAAIAQVPDFKVSWKVEPRRGYTVQPSEPRVLRIYDKRSS